MKTCDELVIGLVSWILSEDIDNRVWPWKDFMTINLISLHYSDFRYVHNEAKFFEEQIFFIFKNRIYEQGEQELLGI